MFFWKKKEANCNIKFFVKLFFGNEDSLGFIAQQLIYVDCIFKLLEYTTDGRDLIIHEYVMKLSFLSFK